MTKAEKAYMGRVAELGCMICKMLGIEDSPAELHHLFDSSSRSNWLIAPVCPAHHRGPRGFHGLGQRAFEATYKTTEAELLAMTIEALNG